MHGGSISFKRFVPTHERVFDSNFIWLYHIMNELVNYLHILILGKFSLLIEPKFVPTPHNKDKTCSTNVSCTSEFSSNFDLTNMILLFTKDLS
jgi:hypothetical protein